MSSFYCDGWSNLSLFVFAYIYGVEDCTYRNYIYQSLSSDRKVRSTWRGVKKVYKTNQLLRRLYSPNGENHLSTIPRESDRSFVTRETLGNILRTSVEDDGDGVGKKKKKEKEDLQRRRRKHFEGTTVREFLTSDATTKAFPTGCTHRQPLFGREYLHNCVHNSTNLETRRDPFFPQSRVSGLERLSFN